MSMRRLTCMDFFLSAAGNALYSSTSVVRGDDFTVYVKSTCLSLSDSVPTELLLSFDLSSISVGDEVSNKEETDVLKEGAAKDDDGNNDNSL